jgi:hypothetical protein
MLRCLLLVVISGTCVYISGQGVNSGVTAGTGNVAVTPGTYVVNGYVTTIGNGQIVTPTAAFDTPAPTVGVSNAGRTGISNNAPLSNGALSVTPPSSIAFTSAAPVVTTGTAAAETSTGLAAEPVNQASATGDFGPSYFAGAESAASTTGPMSVAELATQYKSRQGSSNAHTYTNADIEQLVNKKSGVVLANNSSQAWVTSGSASSQAQPAQPQPSITANSNAPAALQRPESTLPGSDAQTAQNTAPAPQPTSQVSEENQNSATTPRINQPQSQPGSREGETKSLPATATLLPLLGLIGILTGGFGLFYRRPRR